MGIESIDSWGFILRRRKLLRLERQLQQGDGGKAMDGGVLVGKDAHGECSICISTTRTSAT